MGYLDIHLRDIDIDIRKRIGIMYFIVGDNIMCVPDVYMCLKANNVIIHYLMGFLLDSLWFYWFCIGFLLVLLTWRSKSSDVNFSGLNEWKSMRIFLKFQERKLANYAKMYFK